MRTRSTSVLLLVTATFALACAATLFLGCAADPCQQDRDPIETLLCETPSSTYGAEYWIRQAELYSPTWSAAFALCKEHGFPPRTRCGLVARAGLMRDLRAEAEAARRRFEERRAGERDSAEQSAEEGFTGLPPGVDPEAAPPGGARIIP